MLKKINFWVSQFIPQKFYWFLAGIFRPYQAVLEDAENADAVYKRGTDITDLLEKFKLIDKNATTLDIGSGVGRAEYALSGKVKSCVGVDISPSMVNIAKQKVNAKNVEFFVNNGDNLKLFSDNSFDLVFSFLVFQHIPKKSFINYLSESFRVLKKKGKICFQIPVYFKDKPVFPPESHPWALRFYNLEEITSFLKKAGFSKIKFYDAHGNKLKNTENQAVIVAEH